MTRRIRHELRGPVSALVLLGLVARLLLPLPALAAPGVSDLLAGVLCLPSGQHAPDETPAATPETDHCALCRLPDALGMPPPGAPALPLPGWSRLVALPLPATDGLLRPPPRGPPPARAPPAPTLG